MSHCSIRIFRFVVSKYLFCFGILNWILERRKTILFNLFYYYRDVYIGVREVQNQRRDKLLILWDAMRILFHLKKLREGWLLFVGFYRGHRKIRPVQSPSENYVGILKTLNEVFIIFEREITSKFVVVTYPKKDRKRLRQSIVNNPRKKLQKCS